MKKDIILFISFILAFVIFIFSITNVYLATNIKNRGSVEVDKEYFDIIFSNATINLETDSYLIIDNLNKKLKIRIKDLNDFKNENSFSLYLYNIGNIDCIFDNHLINIISSSVKENNVKINLSLSKDTKISFGEKKKLKVSIKYNGKSDKKEFLNAEIKLDFKEITQ